MSSIPTYGRVFNVDTWGSTFNEVITVSGSENIFICHAKVSDLDKIALELAENVNDKSWIVRLDERARRAYEPTALRTANTLLEIFRNNLTTNNRIVSEFGELMVSIGSSKALEIVFGHRSLPIAELWKPKRSQNEGFDFHTVCPENVINFGEAKFSGSSSPYGGNSGDSTGAAGQADAFIENSKHLMDNMHLGSLAGQDAANNLDNDLFGVVLAFSINAVNPLLILKNALESSLTYENLKKAKKIYIVGISYGS